MANNLHNEHRDRVRKDLLNHGFDDETPLHKIVEMLLFYSIPRIDTNEIAHELVNRFGTLSKILSAPESELLKIKGVGPNTVAFFKLISVVSRRNIREKFSRVKKFGSLDEIGDYLLMEYFGFTEETFAVTTFNGRGEKIGFDIIGYGDIESVGVSIRKILETVINRKATAIIISHNHPNASAMPSAEDIRVTENINDALSKVNVKLLDHIIVAENDYVSLAQSRQFEYIFK